MKDIQKFYNVVSDERVALGYDIFTDELEASFLTEQEVAPEPEKLNMELLHCTPICYFLLTTLCTAQALRYLPHEEKIYYFYDDPVSSDVWLIVRQ